VLGGTGRRIASGIALAALVLFLGLEAGVSAGPAPRIIFTGSEDDIHTRVRSTDLTGNAIQLSADAEQFATINGGLAAFTRHHRRNMFASDVVIEDAATGDRVHKVSDARYPLIFGDASALLFLPDNNGTEAAGERDPFVHSLWYRDLVSGEEQRLADLHDLDPDLHVLHLAASPDAQQVAFTHGNDAFLFEWNIWVSSVNGTGLQQLTTDDRSLYPSFSPDGQTVAFTHLNPNRRCSGSVHLMDADGSNARRLTAGTCEAILLRPIWLDDQTLVVWRWERTDRRFNRPAGLVTVSAQTGQVVDEFVTGSVSDFAVAREAGLVALRMRNSRIRAHDFATGETSLVPGGREIPLGHLHVDGSLELAY
jgi:hypothetical protein